LPSVFDMAGVTRFCDLDHGLGVPTLVPQIFGGTGWGVDLVFAGSFVVRIRTSRKSKSPPCREKRDKGGAPLTFTLLPLRGEAVCLGDGAHGDRVVDVDSSGVERFAIQFEQGRILDFVFQHLHRCRWRQALGFLQQGA